MSETVKSYSQMRRDFYEKYQKKILPCVKKYDSERKKKLISAVICSSIFAVIGLFLLFSISYCRLEGDSLEGALKGGVFMLGLSWWVWYAIKKDFENKIKSKIMPTVCSCFGDLTWQEGGYWYENLFMDSCAVPVFTSSECDDVFQGSYKDVKIDIVEAAYTRGSGKNRTVVFDGVIVKLSMNKDFKNHTVITPDSILHTPPHVELHHTTLEDVVFEKKFDVFTNDDVEARYLITPSFMQRLNNVKTAFKANRIRCAFFYDQLIISLSTNKDLFSLCSLIKPMDDSQQFFQMYEEIVSIIKLIDYFKLDQKIGL